MIVDANVIVSASLGKSQPLVLSIAQRHGMLLIPEQQFREARLVTEARLATLGIDDATAFGWTENVVLPIPNDWYDDGEAEARARLRPAGQKDWPLIALALASGDAVWSNDDDLFGTGIVVWNTHNIKRATSAPFNDEDHSDNG